MTNPTDNAAGEKTTVLPYPMVLITEREDDFSSLHEELEQEIQPRNFIERMYVGDIAALLWEIIRLRRFKTAMLNQALRVALQNVLKQILFKPEFVEKPDYVLEAETLADDWFHSQKAKNQVAKLLRQFLLDESAIVAQRRVQTPVAPAPARAPKAAPAPSRSNGRGPVGRMQSALATALKDDPDWKEF